jgi:lysophospholipase L1-like esterase
MALGDSYTAGESVADEECFVAQLARSLRLQGIVLEEPQRVAKLGWTTAELGWGIERAAPQGPFDLVTLCIGVNNQFRGLSLEEYRGEFHGLLAQAVNFMGGAAQHVIVISIPDWGVMPYGAGFDHELVGRQIDDINKANRKETAAAGAYYVDVTSISRKAFQDPEMVASDGLHPSGKQYAMWVELILPTALNILK